MNEAKNLFPHLDWNFKREAPTGVCYHCGVYKGKSECAHALCKSYLREQGRVMKKALIRIERIALDALGNDRTSIDRAHAQKLIVTSIKAIQHVRERETMEDWDAESAAGYPHGDH